MKELKELDSASATFHTFMTEDIPKPPSRATKDELEAHIKKLTTMLTELKLFHICMYTNQLVAQATEGFNDSR